MYESHTTTVDVLRDQCTERNCNDVSSIDTKHIQIRAQNNKQLFFFVAVINYPGYFFHAIVSIRDLNSSSGSFECEHNSDDEYFKRTCQHR